MKNCYISKTRVVLILLSMVFIRSANGQGYLPIYSPQTDYVTDMVLIYQGSKVRPDWTAARFIPYVYRQQDNEKPAFLFDAFLFIEFRDDLKHGYATGFSKESAVKGDWSRLLDNNFEKGKGVNGLNDLMDSLAKSGVVPERKRKVILTLPEPIPHQKDWGQLGGQDLDFDFDLDRIAAVKWYIDEALKKWQDNNLAQIELAGFYWVAEQSASSKNILPDIADYIKSKNLKFYWIPCWGGLGSKDWQRAGFDAVYQQPNYFFRDNAPDNRVDMACITARQYNMGLEMEFDMRVEQPSFRQKFFDYIEGFKTNQVWQQSSIAYYEGGVALYRLANNTNPDLRELYDALCDIIIERQLNVDKIYKRNKSSKE